MAAKIYVTAVECIGEAGDQLFRVETFDTECASVTLTEKTHNAESWAETAALIGQAIGMLELGPTTEQKE